MGFDAPSTRSVDGISSLGDTGGASCTSAAKWTCLPSGWSACQVPRFPGRLPPRLRSTHDPPSTGPRLLPPRHRPVGRRRLGDGGRVGADLLVFYLGCPAVFTWLLFRRRMGTRGLVVATLVEIAVVEVLATRNPWLTSVPLLFVGIPLAIAVYAP